MKCLIIRGNCGLHIHLIKGQKLFSRLHLSTICYLMFFLSSLFFAWPLYDLVLHNYFIWDSVYNTLMQNSSHMALVRCLQLAFSLKLIALDNEGQFDLFWIPFMFINSICNRWVFLYFSSLEWDVWVCCVI